MKLFCNRALGLGGDVFKDFPFFFFFFFVLDAILFSGTTPF